MSINYREALNQGLREAFQNDERVFLIVEDAWRSVSISSEMSALIMENRFYDLDAPVQRLCAIEGPIPYPAYLEEASIPQKNDSINAVKKMIYRN